MSDYIYSRQVADDVEQQSSQNDGRSPPGRLYTDGHQSLPPLPNKGDADNRDKESMAIVVTPPLVENEDQAVGVHVAQEGNSE